VHIAETPLAVIPPVGAKLAAVNRLGPGRLPLPWSARPGARDLLDRRADPRPEGPCGSSTRSPARWSARTPTRTGRTSSRAWPAPAARREHRLDRDQRGAPGGLIIAPAAEPRPGHAGHPGRPAGPGHCRHRRRRRAVRRVGRVDPKLGIWRYGPDGLKAVSTEPGGPRRHGPAGRDDRADQPGRWASSGGHGAGRAGRRGHRGISPRSRKSRACRTRRRSSSRRGRPASGPPCSFPSWHAPGTRLPVLMCPYGGPGHQEVVKSARVYLTPQWFAEQGFAGRGGGRPRHGQAAGPAWDRTIAGDLSPPASLRTRVTALGAAAEKVHRPGHGQGRHPGGWVVSGGYLAALAGAAPPRRVPRRGRGGRRPPTGGSTTPHYTERYLGDPGEQPERLPAQFNRR